MMDVVLTIRSFSVVAPHFTPPTDFQPDSAPFLRAFGLSEQVDFLYRSHCVPLPFHSGARHGKSSSVHSVLFT